MVMADCGFFELIGAGFLALRDLLLEVFEADGFFVILFIVVLGTMIAAGGVATLEEVEVRALERTRADATMVTGLEFGTAITRSRVEGRRRRRRRVRYAMGILPLSGNSMSRVMTKGEGGGGVQDACRPGFSFNTPTSCFCF